MCAAGPARPAVLRRACPGGNLRACLPHWALLRLWQLRLRQYIRRARELAGVPRSRPGGRAGCSRSQARASCMHGARSWQGARMRAGVPLQPRRPHIRGAA